MLPKIRESGLEENEKKTLRVPKAKAMWLIYVDPYGHLLISCVNDTYDEILGNSILIVIFILDRDRN